MPKNNTNITMSATAIHDFSLHTTDFSSLDNLPDLAFVNEHFGMILNVGSARNDFIKANQPYRFLEGRILWVTDGWADIELTLEEYHIKKDDIVLLAPESIIELKSNSPDYNMIGIIYNVDIPVNESLIIHAGETEMQETLRMANILWDTARHTPFRLKTVTHLLSAIITNIQYINRTEQESTLQKKKTRQELLFSKFKKLVNEHCSRHRTIPFYAEQLVLTPHYLSSLIAKASGRSVMYWINRATLVQAKVLLKNKDMLIYEVAEKLNFPSQTAFGTFFKRETGMTPSEYQRLD